jgi:predicted CoA-binding protein
MRIVICCHRRRRHVAAWVLQAARQRLQAVWAQQQLRHALRRVMRSVILSARSLRLSWHAWQLSLSG